MSISKPEIDKEEEDAIKWFGYKAHLKGCGLSTRVIGIILEAGFLSDEEAKNAILEKRWVPKNDRMVGEALQSQILNHLGIDEDDFNKKLKYKCSCCGHEEYF